MRIASRKDLLVHYDGFRISLKEGEQQDVDKDAGLWIISKYPDVYEVPLDKPKKASAPAPSPDVQDDKPKKGKK